MNKLVYVTQDYMFTNVRYFTAISEASQHATIPVKTIKGNVRNFGKELQPYSQRLENIQR